jgi:flagellar basal-body rod protein FlgF
MDRMIYVAMSGAKQALSQQATVAHNLANVTTGGYRAEASVFRAVPLIGDGAATRTFVIDSTPGADFRPGALQNTGRDLDIAVQGRGWIAVQAPDGSEAYTRAGSLQLNENGTLQTRAGHAVLGDGGPLAVPNDTLVTIGGDGTVSTVPTGNRPSANSVLGRIKLVNPPEASLERGNDGLFRVRGGTAAPADANVRLVSGALEASNVNAVDAMVSMIALARQFDMQMKMLQNAEGNATKAAQLLTMQG